MKTNELNEYEGDIERVVDVRTDEVILIGDPWMGHNNDILEWPSVTLFPYHILDDHGFRFLATTEEGAWLQRAARFCLGQSPLESETRVGDPRALIDNILEEREDWRLSAQLLQRMIHALYQEKNE